MLPQNTWMKACSKCFKITDRYNKDKRASDCLQSQCKDCDKAYRLLHPIKKTREQARKHDKKWKENHRGTKNAHLAKRRAAKLKRTPKWLTITHFDQIELFYDAAHKLSKEFEIQIDVDHIVPLQGKHVSGLHVPWNLQLLQEIANSSKGNK
jgi:hypothetical protein